MAHLAPVTGLALVLEHGHLLGAPLIDHFGHDACAGDRGRADIEGITIADQQDLIQLDAIPCLAGDALDVKLLPLANAVLFAPGANDCVHLSSIPLQADREGPAMGLLWRVPTGSWVALA